MTGLRFLPGSNCRVVLGPFRTLEDLRLAAANLGWVGYFIRYVNYQWFGSQTEMPFNT